MSSRRTSFPKISVITPSYNQGEFIDRTIQSVLSQNYPNLEYWIIDGGSKDSTVKTIKKYGQQLQWVSESDKGQTDAINKGLQRSTGDIVMYLNSDDMMTPGTLRRVAKLFQENPQVAWITGDYQIVNEHDEIQDGWIVIYKRFLRKIMQWGSAFTPILAITNPIIQPSTFWRRSASNLAGAFDVDLRYTMDYDYWWRLRQHTLPLISSETFSQFRVHNLSKGSTAFELQMTEQLMVARRYHPQLVWLWLQQVHNVLIILIYNFIRRQKP